MQAKRYVSYEVFSARNALGQANTVHDLVAENSNWLKASQYAGVTERYVTRSAAVRNVLRLAFNKIVTPVILYDSNGLGGGETPIGLGTIIDKQSVRHPITGEIVRGADVDYWLSIAHQDPETHTKAAEVMVAAGRTIVPDSRLFATIVVDEPYQPYGFRDNPSMQPVGGTARLTIPGDMPADPFDITRGGKLVQLYADSSIHLPS